MKIKLFFLLLVSNVVLSQNFSFDPVLNPIPPVPGAPSTEIFRFRPGVVTQLDFNAIPGQGFTFNNSRWFAFGRVPAGTQTFYGLRFQLPNKAITMGYNDLNALNPRIEWIGDQATGNLGNLEYRVGTSLGSPGFPGGNILVATMTSFGNTVFGPSNPFGNSATSPRVGVVTSNTNAMFLRTNSGQGLRVRTDTGLGILVETGNQGMDINSFGQNGFNVSTISSSSFATGGSLDTSGASQNNFGLYMKTFTGDNATGIQSFAFDANNNIGVRGTTFGQGSFEAAIYGETPSNGGASYFAGFFDGDVFSSTGNYLGSDSKLKENVKVELDALEIINQLNPVTYDFKKVEGLNLSNLKQHGFIAQELAEVLPELTKDVNKPVYDKEGKKVSEISFKSVNYTGLISILTAGIQELHDEVKNLKEELANYKAGDEVRSNLIQDSNLVNDYYMEQNVPNPFDSQTTIKYQLPNGLNQASITVFDLNGRFIRDYSINKNNGEIVINASEIGKGLFLYSLIQNGKEIMTKKMVIK